MIVWSQDFSVGINEIDEQHKELFTRVNKLIEAMSQGKGKTEIDGVVAFLEAYVVEHFRCEEMMMMRKNYPQYVEHKAMHAEFAKTFADIKADIDKTGAKTVAIVQVHKNVVAWLTSHICKQDRAFGAFLKVQSQMKAA